jgi:hypothetical protein
MVGPFRRRTGPQVQDAGAAKRRAQRPKWRLNFRQHFEHLVNTEDDGVKKKN